MAEVENILAKFEWAKTAQNKVEKLQAEGKPVPKTMAEVLITLHSISHLLFDDMQYLLDENLMIYSNCLINPTSLMFCFHLKTIPLVSTGIKQYF